MLKFKIYAILIAVISALPVSLYVYETISGPSPADLPIDGETVLAPQFAILQDDDPVDLSSVEMMILPQITDFESCVEANNLIFLTYPAKCIAADGQIFTESTVNVVKVGERVEE